MIKEHVIVYHTVWYDWEPIFGTVIVFYQRPLNYVAIFSFILEIPPRGVPRIKTPWQAVWSAELCYDDAYTVVKRWILVRKKVSKQFIAQKKT